MNIDKTDDLVQNLLASIAEEPAEDLTESQDQQDTELLSENQEQENILSESVEEDNTIQNLDNQEYIQELPQYTHDEPQEQPSQYYEESAPEQQESLIPMNIEELEEEIKLGPDSRVGMALYLTAMNHGVVTPEGVLMSNGLNMTQIAHQAEVPLDYTIKKSMSRIRKAGYIKNRTSDGRLLIQLTELEAWLKEEGAAIDLDDEEE